MKVLFAVPHYFRPSAATDAGPTHGSRRADPAPRIEALAACLNAVRRVVGPRSCVLSHVGRQAIRTSPPDQVRTDVIVCTTSGYHLLDRLDPANGGWLHHATNGAPRLLGYECHAVLRDRLGDYDYYCYLEDDIVLTDPWLFRKLAWFGRLFGDARLLQPNRFEVGDHPHVDKIYVDGDLPPHCTAQWRRPADPESLSAEVCGRPVAFRTTTNPHSGCFFLSAAQMEMWSATPYFLDRSDAFIGPLESAATLGLVRTFDVFKPGIENANFFEVQHHGSGYLRMVLTGE